MFLQPTPKAELRLIDFGSGVKDDPNAELGEGEEFGRHSTFAGSAFYISPEMFQRTYIQKTDVWSVGVTLYVLVAGYPADQLQKAFNILQTAKNRDLKKLPNLPENMPESYYDMLEGLLVYRHKQRKSAEEMLSHEFVTFHKDLEEEEDGISFEQIAAAAAAGSDVHKQDQSVSRKSQSIALTGSVVRHTLMLGYQKFERSLTTLLATMLDSNEFDRLIKMLENRIKGSAEDKASSAIGTGTGTTNETEVSNGALHPPEEDANEDVHRERLDIIPIHALKKIIKEDFKRDDM